MKRRDVILVLILLAAAGALFAVSQMSAKGGAAAQVVVKLDGVEKMRKPLVVSAEYEFRQENGDVNIVAVENGEVYMKEANCRDGLCLNMGRMKNSAKNIVCLPHKLVVSIEGGEMPQDADDVPDVIVQ